VEASHALARLDADRLEEMVASCESWSRDVKSAGLKRRAAFAVEWEEVADEMAVFAHVLEATRANLSVMDRLIEMHSRRAESVEGYGLGKRWRKAQVQRGND